MPPSNFQQFAFNYSTSGKIAFITAFYMLFVPLFGLVLGKRVPALTWGCVLLGTVGLYFLCIGPEGITSINRGDVLTLVCAVIFAIHILAIEKLAPEVDSIKLSCTQFFVSGAISCILMLIFESPSLPAIRACIVPLLYSGHHELRPCLHLPDCGTEVHGVNGGIAAHVHGIGLRCTLLGAGPAREIDLAGNLGVRNYVRRHYPVSGRRTARGKNQRAPEGGIRYAARHGLG